VTRLARVGYDNALGYLKGGFEAWAKEGKETDEIISASADDLAEMLYNEQVNIIDVRKESEYNSEHMIEAINMPLDFINNNISSIDKNLTYYVHCAAGYRSMLFISILRSMGYKHLIDVKGGFNEIKKTNKFKLTDYVCPTTLL
jgi:rhodanese-related sulfurtransferase